MSKKRKKRPSAPPRRSPAGPLSPQTAATLQSALKAQPRTRPANSTGAGSAAPPGASPPRPQVAPEPAVAAVPLEVTPLGCGPVEGKDPQALGLTYWFEAPQDGPATTLTVRFEGQRLGVQGAPGPKDRFVTQATVDPVLPGSGRTAITARVLDVAPGEWQVSATPVAPPNERPGRPLPRATGRGSTAFAPVVRVRAPGVRLGAWPAMVLLGTVLGLGTQAALAARRDEPALRVFLLTLLACVIGVVGAKAYYLLTHRGAGNGLVTVGMSVQGFVIGCVGTLVLGSGLIGVPLGVLLDVSAPGLLIGMTVGRIGCFFGGCCAGRPTASRWGLWSSDRRLGTRRIPVQLMESAMAGLVFVSTLLVVAVVDLPYDGLAFVGGIAAYILGRNLLFPLRDLPRATTYGRQITIAVAAALLALVAVIAVAR